MHWCSCNACESFKHCCKVVPLCRFNSTVLGSLLMSSNYIGNVHTLGPNLRRWTPQTSCTEIPTFSLHAQGYKTINEFIPSLCLSISNGVSRTAMDVAYEVCGAEVRPSRLS
jgi:hypothetical protein